MVKNAPFFSIARFGPGMIFVLSIMVVLTLVATFYFKFYSLAFFPLGIFATLSTCRQLANNKRCLS